MTETTMVRKPCCRCHENWPATSQYYYSDKSREDRLDVMCKGCRKESKERSVRTFAGAARHFCAYCGLPTEGDEFSPYKDDMCRMCFSANHKYSNGRTDELDAEDVERCQRIAAHLLNVNGLKRSIVRKHTLKCVHPSRLAAMTMRPTEL